MTPADTANEALNETLAAVQLLMKRCMMLRQGDPEALKLSDEIARRLANNLKCHAGIATLLSPELLSCAAIVRDCSKGGIFQTLPDWGSVTDKDPRIKGHPWFNKTINYRPIVSIESPVLPDAQTPTAITRISSSSSSSGTSALVSLTTPPVAAISTSAPPPGDIDHSSISATPAIELSPLSPSPFSKALEPLTPLPVSAPIPLKYNLFVPGIKNAVNAIPKGGNGKKRRAEDDQLVEAKIVDNSISRSRKSVLKRKRVMSADEDNETTNPVLTQVVPSQRITKEDLASARSHHSEGTDDRGFWDAESRPVEWGQDSAIATAVKYSVRHHPQKCNKCTKLSVACLVLPDKKFGYIRLACANCDDMKITCAINGVGVRERMQAKATAAGDAHPILILPALSSLDVEPNNIEHGDSAPDANPMSVDIPPVHTEVQPMPMMYPSVQAEAKMPQAVNPAQPKPTARDILQSIQDLGRQLDLLATSERVDELDARLGSVEDVFGRRLSALEQHLNSSDTEWRAMSASVGHLTIALRDHKDDLTAHHSRINTTTYAPLSHANAHLPAWLTQSDEDPHISAIGRQWTHAWDASVMMGVQEHVGTSASAVLITETVDSMVPAVDVSPDTSSDLSMISND
ncbi:uncharacterized protein F5891DRAFT_1183604 [Suillus fuscotomentosus]|uniref:Uncharacterized protein n=1 Tax=Suillus fuscotomentosus TaxID=1912939 RepID=A0AAD4EF29_9AGAM|nr:uncharacterized protein F5891DRAFT_1183604 [Suillus fuscotomentosus]KAG1904957.1 hypothetical protein F5891DRAFT_1183604 [Suillus fuscotomentosus]